MNLTGLLIATSLLGIGAYGSIGFLTEPPMAVSRLSAQAEAESITERLQLAALRGSRVTPGPVIAGRQTVLLDGEQITLPAACQALGSHQGNTGIYLKCLGSQHKGDKRKDNERHSVAALVGANPCGSDLFPDTPVCKESENPRPTSNPNPGTTELAKGHFDLDSYGGFNTKGLHTHAWDDKTGLGWFDLYDPSGPIGGQSPITLDYYVANKQEFFISVVNPNLSPDMRIRIEYGNGLLEDCNARDYGLKGCAAANNGAMPTYYYSKDGSSLGGSSARQLKKLILYFESVNAISRAGIIPTSTGYVTSSQSHPGKNSEYRNGAFVVQVVTPGGTETPYLMSTNTKTSTGQCPGNGCRQYTSNGGSGLYTQGVRYEASVFWHAPKAVYNSNSPFIPGQPSSVASFLALQ
ncbi:MAG: hypothetical protein VKI83_05725 [Synechococcaceae cyanobacterium]|nr:hypothetical protein [Synechococcaceae cyanobacterium]